jgi:hypothetical protein
MGSVWPRTPSGGFARQSKDLKNKNVGFDLRSAGPVSWDASDGTPARELRARGLVVEGSIPGARAGGLVVAGSIPGPRRRTG